MRVLVTEDEVKMAALLKRSSVSGPTGSYEGALVIEETTPLEPDVRERKSYAPGVGLIREESVDGSSLVELVEVIGAPAGG